MSLADQEVSRVYSCTNCKGKIGVVQTVKEGFLKDCPFCFEPMLVIDSGNMRLSFNGFAETPKYVEPERIRSQSYRDKYKDVEKPWWRKEGKRDFSILKNPTKYIETGTT